jgi:hypothetical protein
MFLPSDHQFSIEVQAKMFKTLILVIFVGVSCVNCESEYERFDRLFGNVARKRALAQSNGNPRIVGGETSPQHYPYMISLQMESRGGGGGFPFFFQQPRSNWSHFCGGSVYSENFIITAARELIQQLFI